MSIFLRFFVFFFSFFVVFLLPFFVFADTIEETIADLEKKKKEYQSIIAAKKREQGILGNEIIKLDAQERLIQEDIVANQSKIDSLNVEIVAIEGKIAELERSMAVQRDILAHLVRTFQERSSGEKTFLADRTAFDSGRNNFVHVDQIANTGAKVQEFVETTKAIKKRIEEERQVAQEKKNQILKEVENLAQRKMYLEGIEAQKTAALRIAKAEEVRYADKLEKVEEDLRREIAKLEYDKIGNADFPPPKNGELGSPVDRWVITQRYGKTSFSIRAYTSGVHNGIDFGGNVGDPIYAAEQGTVVGTGDLGRYAYGRWVAIDHRNGLVTLYGHLSKISVSRGDRVKRGDKIGTMGSTGYSTGPHLHFGVYSQKTFEVVVSKSVPGQNVPVGAHTDPLKYF